MFVYQQSILEAKKKKCIIRKIIPVISQNEAMILALIQMKAFKSTGTMNQVRIDFISCISGPLWANQRVLKSQPVSAAEAMFDHNNSFSAEKTN